MTALTMPIDKLRAAGEALHGSRWMSPLARDIDVDSRLVRFWMSGAREVPDRVIERLSRILREEAALRRQDADRIEALAEML